MSEAHFVILGGPGEAEASSAEEQLAEEYSGLRCAEGAPGPLPAHVGKGQFSRRSLCVPAVFFGHRSDASKTFHRVSTCETPRMDHKVAGEHD